MHSHMLLFYTILHVELHGIVHTKLNSSETPDKRADMNYFDDAQIQSHTSPDGTAADERHP